LLVSKSANFLPVRLRGLRWPESISMQIKSNPLTDEAHPRRFLEANKSESPQTICCAGPKGNEPNRAPPQGLI
jgi:hypothetical protein